MGRKPILLPIEKSDLYTESIDWNSLKNRFSGKVLFDSNLYYLISGNLSALDKIENPWFYEEILRYSDRTHDTNFLPVLRKIASGTIYNESLRQRAIGIIEVIEGQSGKKSNGIIASSMDDVDKRAENARKLLAGIRYPQTTEILRLLRDRSVDLKRLAIYLIGKFKIADMIQELCECINIPELEEDALKVLSEFGNAAGKEISRFYLKHSGNLTTSKAILRLFSDICPEENMSFVLERVWAHSRQIKEIAIKSVLKCNYKVNEEEKDRLEKLIFETFGQLTWILSVIVAAGRKNESCLTLQLRKEFSRWQKFLLNLLLLSYGEYLSPYHKERSGSGNYSKTIHKLAEIVFSDLKVKKGKSSEIETEKKLLSKLQTIFPFEIPADETLYEEIINCDYNILNIWTKACALRSIETIVNEHQRESVAALIFSPEKILNEEALRLMARSEWNKYSDLMERVPEQNKQKVENILSSRFDERGMVFEKTIFLVSVFPENNEEDLIFLAEKTEYHKIENKETIRQFKESIVWLIGPERKISRTMIIYDRIEFDINNINLISPESFCYVLPLKVLELYRIQNTDKAYLIFKNVDNIKE